MQGDPGGVVAGPGEGKGGQGLVLSGFLESGQSRAQKLETGGISTPRSFSRGPTTHIRLLIHFKGLYWNAFFEMGL